MTTRRRPGQELHKPELGELVLDLATGREGTYQGIAEGKSYLRPAGGGIEWSTAPWELVPAKAAGDAA